MVKMSKAQREAMVAQLGLNLPKATKPVDQVKMDAAQAKRDRKAKAAAEQAQRTADGMKQ